MVSIVTVIAEPDEVLEFIVEGIPVYVVASDEPGVPVLIIPSPVDADDTGPGNPAAEFRPGFQAGFV